MSKRAFGVGILITLNFRFVTLEVLGHKLI